MVGKNRKRKISIIDWRYFNLFVHKPSVKALNKNIFKRKVCDFWTFASPSIPI